MVRERAANRTRKTFILVNFGQERMTPRFDSRIQSTEEG